MVRLAISLKKNKIKFDKIYDVGTFNSIVIAYNIEIFRMCRGSSVVEHLPEEQSVDGPIPSPGTIFLSKILSSHLYSIMYFSNVTLLQLRSIFLFL